MVSSPKSLIEESDVSEDRIPSTLNSLLQESPSHNSKDAVSSPPINQLKIQRRRLVRKLTPESETETNPSENPGRPESSSRYDIRESTPEPQTEMNSPENTKSYSSPMTSDNETKLTDNKTQLKNNAFNTTKNTLKRKSSNEKKQKNNKKKKLYNGICLKCC